ncbi:hypothetical protein D3C85_1367210 [compost metagenome]
MHRQTSDEIELTGRVPGTFQIESDHLMVWKNEIELPQHRNQPIDGQSISGELECLGDLKYTAGIDRSHRDINERSLQVGQARLNRPPIIVRNFLGNDAQMIGVHAVQQVDLSSRVFHPVLRNARWT